MLSYHVFIMFMQHKHTLFIGFGRLFSVYRSLRVALPAVSEGMQRMIQCLEGTTPFKEDSIVAMLPDEVTIVCQEEKVDYSDSWSESSAGYGGLFD